MIKLGIACEGNRDEKPIQVIIEKILRIQNVDFEVVKIVKPHTGILGYVSSYARQFFEGDLVDVAIFLTDQDGESYDRRKMIIDRITKINPTYLNYSAIGVAEPHFERWLLADEDTVKRLIGLSGADPLPYKDKEPKSQLQLLRDGMSIPKPTLQDLYTDLAKELRIKEVKDKCDDFCSFADELKNACRFVETNRIPPTLFTH